MDRRFEARNRLIIALDTSDPTMAANWVQHLSGHCGFFKAGLTLESAVGTLRAIEMAGFRQTPVFIDKKLHDIPEQVAGAVSALCAQPNVRIMTLHASGGPKMLEAARVARDAWHAANSDRPKPMLFAVTLLTSIDYDQAVDIGVCPQLNIIDEQERLETQKMYLERHVLQLARLAHDCGIDGIVCSPQEVPMLRRSFDHDDLKLLTPGIRPVGGKVHDQKRVATPAGAIKAGSDFLVVGRPITEAESPVEAAESIINEIEAALAA
ncbi:orotidine-5'-phosphate decarboxylase [Candidatus Uhrbacteria bacterium]|nr:orotidine-5'-phosphate decarboxylase [Candidatus Uhrbacteria bacterium]